MFGLWLSISLVALSVTPTQLFLFSAACRADRKIAEKKQ